MKTLTKPQHPGIIIVHGHDAAHALKSLQSRIRKSLTVNEAIENWSAWLCKQSRRAATLQSIGYVKAWARDAKVGSWPINEVEEGRINCWVNADDGTKLGTRRVRLSVVRNFFRYLSIKEILTGPNYSLLASVDYNSLSHEQKESKEVKPFTDQQFLKLVEHLNAELGENQTRQLASTSATLTQKLTDRRDFLMFWRVTTIISRCTGLRFGDVCCLEWACLKGERFTVWSAKRRRRVQPFIWNQVLFDATVAQINPVNPQYCFPQQRADYLNPHRRPGLTMQFARLCDKLGMEGLSFHCLRHGYSVECLKAGQPMPHIARSLGHSSTVTTAGYCHTD